MSRALPSAPSSSGIIHEDFAVTREELGVMKTYELKPGGADIEVTEVSDRRTRTTQQGCPPKLIHHPFMLRPTSTSMCDCKPSGELIGP